MQHTYIDLVVALLEVIVNNVYTRESSDEEGDLPNGAISRVLEQNLDC